MASKKLHKFGNKCVLNSRGTLFDVESQPRPSSNDEKPEPRTIHIQNPRLLPAFLHSEKKNRRKMVMGPMSCEMVRCLVLFVSVPSTTLDSFSFDYTYLMPFCLEC